MLSVTKIFRTTDAQIDLIMYDPLFFNKLHLPHTKEVVSEQGKWHSPNTLPTMVHSQAFSKPDNPPSRGSPPHIPHLGKR
jgi:hypothetical protein